MSPPGTSVLRGSARSRESSRSTPANETPAGPSSARPIHVIAGRSAPGPDTAPGRRRRRTVRSRRRPSQRTPPDPHPAGPRPRRRRRLAAGSRASSIRTPLASGQVARVGREAVGEVDHRASRRGRRAARPRRQARSRRGVARMQLRRDLRRDAARPSSTARPAPAAPSVPVTPTRSPGRAPSRPTSSPGSSDQPTTVNETINSRAAVTSPPTIATPNVVASSCGAADQRQRVRSSAPLGSPSDKNASPGARPSPRDPTARPPARGARSPHGSAARCGSGRRRPSCRRT